METDPTLFENISDEQLDLLIFNANRLRTQALIEKERRLGGLALDPWSIRDYYDSVLEEE